MRYLQTVSQYFLDSMQFWNTMQRSNRNIFSVIMPLLVVVAMAMPMASSAQTSSVNAYSPYSMYGLGEILTPGSVQMRSMGGVGLGLRNPGQVNTLNPAAASIAPQKSFLFDVNFDATHYRNNQMKYNSEGAASHKAKTAYNTGNIHNISMMFPLAKSLGMVVSVSPYSSVGYKMSVTDQNEDNYGDQKVEQASARIGSILFGLLFFAENTEVTALLCLDLKGCHFSVVKAAQGQKILHDMGHAVALVENNIQEVAPTEDHESSC